MVQVLDSAGLQVDAENIPSGRLTWSGASAEQLAFMRAVYDRQVQRASARRSFTDDVPVADLGTIEDGKQARTAAAAACRSLLAEARAELARQQAAGDEAARRASRIGVASGYRSASRQFRGWQSAFPRYYGQTGAARPGLSGGPHGSAAVDYLARYVGRRLAAPGYSLHNNGLAIDFTTRDSGRSLGPSTNAENIRNWRASWFYGWLRANAARFDFHENTSIDEPWHWEYRASASGSTAAPAATAAQAPARESAPAAEDIAPGRLEIASVPLLRGHRGTRPDLVLRWNMLPDRPEAVDVVVHLHGYSSRRERMTLPADKEPASGLDFSDPAGSGGGRTRPTLGVLPRGNYFGGRSGQGYNFPALVTPAGMRDLIVLALAELGRAAGAPAPSMGRLIITAHSGGGAPLMQILAHLDPHEVHVFDGLYGDATRLNRWARERIRRDAAAVSGLSADAARDYMRRNGGALRVLFRPTTGTQANSLAVHRALRPALAAVPDARDTLAAWYRVERTSVAHGEIPRRFGWRLLADASADLPGASSAAEGVAAEAEEGAGEILEAGPPRPAPGGATRIAVTIEGQVQGLFKNESVVMPKGGAGIRGLGFSYDLASPGDVATGQPAGRRRHGPVTIVKEWGAASPQIFHALVTNENLKRVEIGFWRATAGGVEQLAHVVRLTNARVAAVKQHLDSMPGSDGRPLEEVSFTFQAIEVESKIGQTTAMDTLQAGAR